MVKVYFETPSGSYAEIVAIFNSEITYDFCIDALKKEAEQMGLIVTESIDNKEII